MGMLVRDLGSRVGAGFVAVFALSAAGCEDTPPPNPAGAFYLDFRDTGAECGLASHEAEMGVVGSSGDPELIPNLHGGAEVTCTVEAASGGFRVSAELADAPNLRITIPVLSTENTADNPADGSATYASTDTGGDVYASPPETPCKFWLDAEDGQSVRAGEAWLSFECDAIDNEGFSCALSTSYVAVRNCAGASPEEEE